MGYILKKAGGAGAGDATAANQQKQIDQLAEASGYPSVLKNGNDVSIFSDNTAEGAFQDVGTRSVFKENNLSVFKDFNSNPVFTDSSSNESVFKTVNGNSILSLSKITNTATSVISFQNTTPATLAADIQTFLTTNNICIIQIVYADAGGVAPNPHTALVIYNTI